MDSSGHEDGRAAEPRVCLICGEPAWLDVSERPDIALWVCEDHIAPAYRLELFVARRAFAQALAGEVVRPLERMLERISALAGKVGKYWVVR